MNSNLVAVIYYGTYKIGQVNETSMFYVNVLTFLFHYLRSIYFDKLISVRLKKIQILPKDLFEDIFYMRDFINSWTKLQIKFMCMVDAEPYFIQA